jgi:hypothetical protein
MPARRLGRPPQIERLEARDVPGFINAGSFPVHHAPTSVVVGDFNGDQIPDLATANDLSNDVSVLLGNGDGTFQARTDYPVGDWPNAITDGDFNGDGTLDLAVANGNKSTVSILLNNGDGTFREGGDYDVGGDANGVSVGDFNGDGILDIAAAGEAGVSVLLGNGDGTFRPYVNYLGDANGVCEIAAADYNGDGAIDLAAMNCGKQTVDILLGNGDGSFRYGEQYAVGYGWSVAAGDFRGNGIQDLVTTNETNAGVSVLLGNGDGTFQPAVNYWAGWGAIEVKVGDFNNDGALDIVVANGQSFGPNVHVLLANGDGTFQFALEYSGGGSPYYVETADLTSNGRKDLVIVNDLFNTDGTVTVLLNDGVWTGPSTVGTVELSTVSRPPSAGFPSDHVSPPAWSTEVVNSDFLNALATDKRGDQPVGTGAIVFPKTAPWLIQWSGLDAAAVLGLEAL